MIALVIIMLILLFSIILLVVYVFEKLANAFENFCLEDTTEYEADRE